MLVLVHGAGRRGAAAWPTIERSDARPLDLGTTASIAQHADAVRGEVEPGDVVVAHSLGAVAAVLAVRAGMRPGHMLLVEPALYDIARGVPAVEQHIETMTKVRHAGSEQGPRAFWTLVRPLMFGGTIDPDRWEAERPIAERLLATPTPWGHGIEVADATAVPTTVVTGGWNDEYEAIAAVLAAAGADHRVLEGAEHRPQDLPAFAALLEAVAPPGA